MLAEYFIFWWLALFIVLPIGLRTQDEADEIVPGTVKSAPNRFRPLKVFLSVTILAAILYAIWYVATEVYGLSAMSLPLFFPQYK
jgi:predicted secreted protein